MALQSFEHRSFLHFGLLPQVFVIVWLLSSAGIGACCAARPVAAAQTIFNPALSKGRPAKVFYSVPIRSKLQPTDSTGVREKEQKKFIFLVTDLAGDRQDEYLEPFALMDFNRVDGYFLGLGSAKMHDFGTYDELGLGAGAGYAFAAKRWQYYLESELRFPVLDKADTTFGIIKVIPTVAVGGGVHNLTSTRDGWRMPRLENALDAFFSREDFRDYFKLAGWNAYLAVRPMLQYELRFDWRRDHYQSLSQTVTGGRFAGRKELRPNPDVVEGWSNSLVIRSQQEGVINRSTTLENVFGDSTHIQTVEGESNLLSIELGHMPSTQIGFNKYILDARSFRPFFKIFNWDTRLRYEAVTGDAPFQKAAFLGGPGSLPALHAKEVSGDRLTLLNTELRIGLNYFLSIHVPDLQLALLNDFGFIASVDPSQGLFKEYKGRHFSDIIYNTGLALGFSRGVQVGASWRTDRSSAAHLIFRLTRSF